MPTQVNVSGAVQYNRDAAHRVGWMDRFDQIVEVLGFQHMSPGEHDFAVAVAEWQAAHPPLAADGKLGPGTWRQMEPLTAFTPGSATGPPSWLSQRPRPAARPEETESATQDRWIVAVGARALEVSRQLRGLHEIEAPAHLGSSERLQPGTVDLASRTIYLGQSGHLVYYLRDNYLKAVPISVFAHNHSIGLVAAEVFRRTRWIIPMAEATMAFSMGVAAGVFGVIAVAASVTVVAMKVAVFYTNHRREADAAIAHLDDVLRILRWFRQRCPKTYEKLLGILGRGVWQGILSAPSGATASDGAALLGRMLGGLASAPDTGFRALLTVLRGVVTTLAVRFPGIAVRGAGEHAHAAVDKLVAEMRSAGVIVNDVEVTAMRREFESTGGEAVGKLRELNDKISSTLPVIESLLRSFRIEDVPAPGTVR